jgi:uncharacterized membrane protein
VKLHRSLAVDRPPEEVFELVGDGERYASFFAGLTRWERLSGEGEEDRFRVLACVGPVQAGGVVRVTERRDGEGLAWESETGVEQSGRWRLEPLSGGEATRVHLEISFRLQGPGSRLAERLMARVVDRNMEATLLAVRRMVEFEERVGAGS